MIVYSVTYAIDSSVEKDWIEHMSNSHIPSLMASGYFSEFQHTKIIQEQGLDLAFNVQLTCKNIATLDKYLDEKKDSHELELHQKFHGKFASFFTKLEILK